VAAMMYEPPVAMKTPMSDATTSLPLFVNLGDLVHRGGVVVAGGEPMRRHLVVGHPPHDVRPGRGIRLSFQRFSSSGSGSAPACPWGPTTNPSTEALIIRTTVRM
jgi:hypothetical protein